MHGTEPDARGTEPECGDAPLTSADEETPNFSVSENSVIYSVLAAKMEATLDRTNFAGRLTGALGAGGFSIVGVLFFVAMGAVLYRAAVQKET